MSDAQVFPLGGGCDCRTIRCWMQTPPLFAHCCHCRRCQREGRNNLRAKLAGGARDK